MFKVQSLPTQDEGDHDMATNPPVVNDRPAVPDTMTADVMSLVAGNGRGGNGFDSKPLVTLFVPAPTRGNGAAPRLNRAAYRADTVNLLLAAFPGMKKGEAVMRTNSCAAYAKAMKILDDSGDTKLKAAALADVIPPLKAAASVKHLAILKVAFANASEAERFAFFKNSAVRRFAIAAGLMSPEEHLREALIALGVDETLTALAEMDKASTAAAATTIKVEIVT
jgi:hypothetical protein